MSLQAAAQHLASRGRGPDTHLVHMAPSEVAGLQALARAHGGTLTVNPHTGLPEAGFLSNLLPMVIGAGITAATGGAAAPWMIGLGMGGLETLRTGSLSKGLMAGLGAYGGAGLGAGLMGAGEAAMSAGSAAAAAPSELAATQAAQAQNAVTSLGLPSSAAEGIGSASFAPQMSANQIAGITPPVAGPASTTAFTAGAAPVSNVATATPLPSAAADATGFQKMQAGLGNLGAMANMDTAKYGLAALTPALMQQNRAVYQGSGPNPYNFAFDWERPSGPSYDSREALQLRGRLRQLAGGGTVDEMSARNAAMTLMADGGQMYAEGGKTKADVAKGMTGASAEAMRYLMGQSAASPATQAAQNYAKPAAQQGFLAGITGIASPEGVHNITTGQLTPWSSANPKPTGGLFGAPVTSTPPMTAPAGMEADPNQPYSFSFDPMTGQMRPAATVMRPVTPVVDYSGGYAAGGGVSHLGDYSDGGRLLRGPGDGVSDSIPATIADKRPARLADGEFVVPARIVSELGNGSTEAGARKLYSMMDRIQKARSKTTGKNRMAVDSRADKALPA